MVHNIFLKNAFYIFTPSLKKGVSALDCGCIIPRFFRGVNTSQSRINTRFFETFLAEKNPSFKNFLTGKILTPQNEQISKTFSYSERIKFSKLPHFLSLKKS
jgi:hypothetical protein